MAERANLEPSLRDFIVPQVIIQPSCIIHSENTLANFELKPDMIHLLPKFFGNHEDDPHMHIKEFCEICSTMKIGVLNDEEIRMRLFSFSLKDSAKAWFYSLRPNSITTWATLASRFLQKFFPAQKTRKIRKEIVQIQQLDGESLCEYWERYKKLLNSCPDHNIQEWFLMHYFYEGLLDLDHMIVDATSGGSLMNKTVEQARETFENVSNNSLHKYCGDSKRKIKKEILEIQQLDGEPFHEYWERYKELLNSCPDHNIPEWLLMHCFYEGLLYLGRMIVDATSGGSLMNKTVEEARETFENVSNNSLHKYCGDSKRKIKKEILEIQQLDGEPFHEYWERYKKLLNSCPDRNIPEWLLMHCFYEGLLYLDCMIVDATSGGSLMNKTVEQARETFENVSNNSLHKYCGDSERKIKKEILEIQQLDGEPFHEYWERYKKLLNSCPDHNIPDWLLMHRFYKGLLYLDRMIVDATSGGSLMNKTVEQARETFENVSNNSLHKHCGDSKRKIKKEILEIQQLDGEPFHEYWVRYKKLLNSYPNHNIPELHLMHNFYEGLLYSDRMIVDATAGGSLMDKTPKQARETFENVSDNSLQFNYRRPPPNKSGVYEASTSSHFEAQITNLTNLVKQLMPVSSNVCAICTTPSHVNEACPQGAEQQSFNDFMMEQAYVVGPYQNNERTISEYNPVWHNHPNFRWSDNQNVQQGPAQPYHQQNHQPHGQAQPYQVENPTHLPYGQSQQSKSQSYQ